jgi:hypothetical protein
MLSIPTRAAFSAYALLVVVAAQAPQSSDAAFESASILLQHGSFDPLVNVPEVPAALQSPAGRRLWIVQFAGAPDDLGRGAVAATGAEIHGYLPQHAYVVRMNAAQAGAVAGLGAVRWVGPYHPAYRLEPALLAGNALQETEARLFHVVVVDKHADKPALGANVRRIGGTVVDEHAGSLLCTVSLTGPQLLQAAGFDQVLWIDRWTAVGEDMDNARIQGGGNYIQSQAGYTGAGVNAHIYEGIEAGHQDFTGGATNVNSSGAAQTHGHCTAGIVFGNGTSNPAVRGMAPDAGKFYTNYSSVSTSRWQVVSDLVNIHQASHTTASWGDTQTTQYTAV